MSSADKGDKDDNIALGESEVFRLSPEALQGVAPLPCLDDIEVIRVTIQPPPVWWRPGADGVAVHLLGSGAVAIIAFVAGLTFAGSPEGAKGGATTNFTTTCPALGHSGK